MSPPRSDHPPSELYVIGERVDDPSTLLLQSPDGNYYSYEPPDEQPRAIEIDEHWSVEAHLPDELEF